MGKREKKYKVRVCIVATHPEKGKVEIPLTLREVADVYDLQYMIHEAWGTVKLNRMTRSINSFFRKWEHLEFDVMHDGKCFSLTEKGKRKEHTHYMVKEPRWRR